MEILCKSSFERAKPYLKQLAETDLLVFLKLVSWYADDKGGEWVDVVRKKIGEVNDYETLRYCADLLDAAPGDHRALLAPFTKHKDEFVRRSAFYYLNNLDPDLDYIDTYIDGLYDALPRIVCEAIKALSASTNRSLLTHYREVAKRFPVEQDYVLSWLNRTLEKHGLTNETILTLHDNELPAND